MVASIEARNVNYPEYILASKLRIVKIQKKPNISHQFTKAVENYLLSIFHLDEIGGPVTPTRLSEQLKRIPESEGLGTTLPSVGGMVKRMEREHLVKLSREKDITLTSAGQKAAKVMVRRHRLAERMVVDMLGLELHKAHIEAHRLEHAISDDIENRINRKLGYPKTCPFGHPIPGNGHHPKKSTIKLSDSVQGQNYVVDRVPEDDQSLLKYFVDNSLVPSQKIKTVETAPYRGIIKITTGPNTSVELSYGVAELIWVYPEH